MQSNYYYKLKTKKINYMKSIFFALAILLLTFTTAVSQQTKLSTEQQIVHDKKADTAMANHEVRIISKYGTLTSAQEKSIADACIQVNQVKRQVFRQHWKTPAFHTEIAKVEHLQDSLYASILGAKGYDLIKEKKIRDQQKRLMEAQAKIKATKDSTTTKQ
jgi:hypothetical protein